ncbi:MAG: hypothetical protein Q4C87_09450 [Actinomycetaceae bacterium]|nr:hypothetical protein [Actinomycetaceae bacterium]
MNEDGPAFLIEQSAVYEAHKKETRAALDAAVGECFEAFHMETPPPETLDVCTYCCARPELEGEVRRTSQGEVTASQIEEYLSAARRGDQPSRGWTLFFLPRILELYARGQEPSHIPEVGLMRIADLNWRQTFPARQSKALETFALAWMRNLLTHYPWKQTDEGGFGALVTLALGGFDLQPLLDAWLTDISPSATLNFIRDWSYEYFSEGAIRHPFLEEKSDIVAQLHEWIRSPIVRSSFYSRIMELDPALVAAYEDNIVEWTFLNGKKPVEYISDFLAGTADLPEKEEQ